MIPFVLVVLAVAVVFFWLSFALRRQSGLPAGTVIYSDTGAWTRNEQSLFSKQHGLVGKPDYLVKTEREIVPVEVKSGTAPTNNTPRQGHVMQLAAYCLLVEETYGTRPSYGIIQYANKQFSVGYTPQLERTLLAVLHDMRQNLAAQQAHRTHTDVWRCTSCGVNAACDERLNG